MEKVTTMIKLWTICALFVAVRAGEFTEQCPKECKCVWTSGNKAAYCNNTSIIPNGLSPQIQILDLTGNTLYEIKQNAFVDVDLNNLKKLFLKECKLEEIHRRGFSGLRIMIELDLSNNNIASLHSETFKDLNRIRLINLNNNKLTKLEDGLFNHMEQLQKVELSNNLIVQIGLKTFMDVSVKTIYLNKNKLEHLKVDTFNSLPSLTTLELNDNPWRCDCYLQPFRNWVTAKKLSTQPTSCAEPPSLHDKLWKNLGSDDFACKPNIIYPATGSVVRSSDTNITLSCRVSGNPVPSANWVLNSKIIDGSDSYKGRNKYFITQSIQENTRWVNLTIVDADGSDNGEYVCGAKNTGGVEEKSLTLFVTHSPPGVIAPAGIDSNMMPVLIGISCSAAILLIILVILCYCCCRRRVSDKKKKADTSNGEALIEGSVIPEMEKSLINTINPVTKPPRRYDVPPSITSGATEMSELNKTLLDIDSVYAVNDDEKHSLDFDHDLNKRSQEMLNYGRQDGRAYPPDLLSFPARDHQISPAASNTSTLPDTSRLPPQLNPTSPVHSPIYGVNQNNIFRTLPYSRSQSPFIAPVAHTMISPRQGYVTIPRRPRVPSWSSTASTQILPSSEAQEPLYDNLGLRTTADGSSVLSLNKAGLDQQMSPMRGRPLPATPTLYHNPQPIFYPAIEEQEAVTSPSHALYATNPRNSVSSQMSGQFSTPGPQEPVNPRVSWAAKNSSTPQPESRKPLYSGSDISRNSVDSQPNMGELSALSRKGNKPETGSLRRNLRTETKDDIPSPKSSPVREDTRQNDSSFSLNQSNTLGRSGKIPPRPPPKPKKKPNPESNDQGILFEDEGEDGTEV